MVEGALQMTLQELIGFSDRELGYENTKSLLQLSEGRIRIIGEESKSFGVGKLEIISLRDLRLKSNSIKQTKKNSFQSIAYCDVKDFLRDKDNSNSTFQVASQFNLLEMASPNVTPENGISGYWYDHTQGPRCCQSTVGATLYRNYFMKMPNGKSGQSTINQINCLDEVLNYLSIRGDFEWKFINGYIIIKKKDFIIINEVLDRMTYDEKDKLRGLLKIGIHSDIEVNDDNIAIGWNVNQVLSSALPLSYCDINITSDIASPFCKLILEATYEATIIAAILNENNTDSCKLFLTKVGGGAFGHNLNWISDSIQQSIDKYPKFGLEINLLHYREIELEFENIIIK